MAIAKPQGLAWTENGLKLNALTATVLRISKETPTLPSTEEKPELNPSNQKKDIYFTTPTSVEEKTELNLQDHMKEQSLSQNQPQNQPTTSETKDIVVQDMIAQDTSTHDSSQNVLPNTGTEKQSTLVLAGIGLLTLLGLGSFLKKKEEK